MTDDRSPPPQPEDCLRRPYPSSQKGGTLIVEGVSTLQQHERLLNGGGYRPPEGCPKCAQGLHVHDYRTRVLLEDPAGVVTVVRFLCSMCRATWQMLPAFVARHLRRSWPRVEAAVAAPQAQAAARPEPPIPRTTRRRWLSRLAASAALLVAALGTAERPELTAVAGAVGLEGTRRELVDEHTRMAAVPVGQQLTQVAALVHRLLPGVRLM